MNIDDKATEEIIYKLDDIATNFCPYEYGLPKNHAPEMTEMKNAIKAILKTIPVQISIYERMWNTLKAESGYRKSISHFAEALGMDDLNSTLKELMEYVENAHKMKTKYECIPFYEAVSCECGGAFINEIGPIQLLTDPPKKEFGCGLCGATRILELQDFPQMKLTLGSKIVG